MQLTGKIALVTGGGRGIGRGIVDRYLEEGAHVAIAQRRPLEPALANHPAVFGIQADLRSALAANTIVTQAAEHFGGIDVLVNNAGIMSECNISEIQVEEWDRMIAINLRAPLFLAQAALPYMRQRGGGSIINLGSIEGIAANPSHATYCASKAGIHGMTRAMAVDFGKDNIRCNAIAPGWITTELSETYLDSLPHPDAARAALEQLHPLGRVGQPADVGDLAVFLASDQSSFMTGQIVVLDGGRTAKLPLPN